MPTKPTPVQVVQQWRKENPEKYKKNLVKSNLKRCDWIRASAEFRRILRD